MNNRKPLSGMEILRSQIATLNSNRNLKSQNVILNRDDMYRKNKILCTRWHTRTYRAHIMKGKSTTHHTINPQASPPPSEHTEETR